jgi:hypothetical protein
MYRVDQIGFLRSASPGDPFFSNAVYVDFSNPPVAVIALVERLQAV